MLLALYLTVSIGPFLFTWWRFSGWYAWKLAIEDRQHRKRSSRYDRPADGEEFSPSIDAWVGAYLLGFFVGIVWPLAVLGFAFSKIFGVQGFNYMPKKAKMQQLQARIDRLEKEAGIK